MGSRAPNAMLGALIEGTAQPLHAVCAPMTRWREYTDVVRNCDPPPTAIRRCATLLETPLPGEAFFTDLARAGLVEAETS